MSRHITVEVSTGIGWGVFTTIPPRDPDEEDEDQGEEDDDSRADEPAFCVSGHES